MVETKVVSLASVKLLHKPKSKRKFNLKRAVQLRSGGCAMTIESQDGLGVHCVWQDDVGGLQRDSFMQESLVYFEDMEIVFTPDHK